MKKTSFVLALPLLFLLTACPRPVSNSSYSYYELGRASEVTKGKIISLRLVEVEGTKGVGTLGGATAGGAMGSMLGGNSAGNVAGAIGGAVIGGVAGSVAEESLTKNKAVEVIVEGDDGKTFAVVQVNEEGLRIGDRVLVIHGYRTRVIRDNSVGTSDRKPEMRSDK